MFLVFVDSYSSENRHNDDFLVGITLSTAKSLVVSTMITCPNWEELYVKYRCDNPQNYQRYGDPPRLAYNAKFGRMQLFQ